MKARGAIACAIFAHGLWLLTACDGVEEPARPEREVAVARSALFGSVDNTRLGVISYRIAADLIPVNVPETACSGVVITDPRPAPQGVTRGDILLTAKHCVGSALIGFTNSVTIGDSEIGVARSCTARTDPNSDLALIRFDRPIPGVPPANYVPIDFSPVSVGTQVTVVGLGNTFTPIPPSDQLGVRRSGTMLVTAVDQNFQLTGGGDSGPALVLQSEATRVCPGDSGGPALRNERVVGIASGSNQCPPATGGIAAYTSLNRAQSFVLDAIRDLRAEKVLCPPGVTLTASRTVVEVNQPVDLKVGVLPSDFDTQVQLNSIPFIGDVPFLVNVPPRSTATFTITPTQPGQFLISAFANGAQADVILTVNPQPFLSSTCTQAQKNFCRGINGGCFCEDGACTGGGCPVAPGACSNELILGCAWFGCGCTRNECTDVNCMPAKPKPPVPSSTCMPEQIEMCRQKECACEFGMCTGGKCEVQPGACTNERIEECDAEGCGCTRGVCTDGDCPKPKPSQIPPPPPPPPSDKNIFVDVLDVALFFSCFPGYDDICRRGGCGGCVGTVFGDMCFAGRCPDDDYESLLERALASIVPTDLNPFGDSPIVIDVAGDGFDLTSARAGVRFDIRKNGQPVQLAWTSRGDDDAWLVLDRNGNGRIDDGGELFGNYTLQATPDERNGFLALELYDQGEGGNDNGYLDENDEVFDELRLWRDADHDGVTDYGELKSLASAGIRAISLDYRESRRKDRHGNEFRYRAWVYRTFGSDVGWLTYDVFLTSTEPQ